MIIVNFKVYDNDKTFVTDFTLPTGEVVYKDENDMERVGFEKLIGYEGETAILRYSDGREEEVVLIESVTDDTLTVSYDTEEE